MLTKSLAYLSQIKENNYREWYHENKQQYGEAKEEFSAFVHKFIEIAMQIDSSIKHIEAKDCIFKLHRDTRFSKDKSPFKTHFGAYVARGGGRKSEYAGYYVHFEPDKSMLAGGAWLPPPDILKGIRNEIFHNYEEFNNIISEPNFKSHFSEMDTTDMLKTAPRDFPKDWPNVNLLKYKNYMVLKSFPDDNMLNDSILNEMHTACLTMLPLNNFMNRVIEDLR